jgi:adenylate cyclase
VRDDFAVIEIDLIRVKGKTEPETVFALLGDGRVRASADFATLRDAHAEMLSRYRGRDWAGARERLAICRTVAAELAVAGLYDLYAERIESHEAEPPPPDWTGVYVATSK